MAQTYYFKGQGEIDVIWLRDKLVYALEVKWANQLRPIDFKTLKQFHNAMILTKLPNEGQVDHIKAIPLYNFLYHIST